MFIGAALRPPWTVTMVPLGLLSMMLWGKLLRLPLNRNITFTSFWLSVEGFVFILRFTQMYSWSINLEKKTISKYNEMADKTQSTPSLVRTLVSKVKLVVRHRRPR